MMQGGGQAQCWCLPPGVCLALTGTATAWAEGAVEATAIVQQEADLSVRFLFLWTQPDARLPFQRRVGNIHSRMFLFKGEQEVSVKTATLRSRLLISKVSHKQTNRAWIVIFRTVGENGQSLDSGGGPGGLAEHRLDVELR